VLFVGSFQRVALPLRQQLVPKLRLGTSCCHRRLRLTSQQRLFTLLLLLTFTACTPFVPRRPLTSYFKEAETLLAEQKYSQAATLLEEAAQAHPEDTRTLLRLGQIYLRQGQPVAAEDAFNRSLARDLSQAPAMAGLAEVKLRQGDLGQALYFWQQAAAVDPDLPGVYTGLGRTHLLRFEFDQAKEAFLAQQARRPDPETQWYLAALEAPSDFATANHHLLSIPHNVSADLLARRDYLLAALVPFTAESAQAEIAQAVGIAFIQVEQWPLAVHALTAAAQYPDQAEAEKAESLAFLGHALAQAGRPALELFEQAAALKPDSALPLYFHGIYLREQGA
jgi:tetratricopeptide (TPR) repeat protein